MTPKQFYQSVELLESANREFDLYLTNKAKSGDTANGNKKDIAALKKIQDAYNLFDPLPATFKGLRLNRIFRFSPSGDADSQKKRIKHFANASDPNNHAKIDTLLLYLMHCHADSIDPLRDSRELGREHSDAKYYWYFLACAYVLKYFNNFRTFNGYDGKQTPSYAPIYMSEIWQHIVNYKPDFTDYYGNPLTMTDGKPTPSKKQWLLDSIEAYREAHGSAPTIKQLVKWINDHIEIVDGKRSSDAVSYLNLYKLLKRHDMMACVVTKDTPTPTEPETALMGGETQTAEPTHTEAFDRMPRAEEIMSTEECAEWLSRNDIEVKKRTYSTLDELTFGEPEPVTTEDGSVALF